VNPSDIAALILSIATLATSVATLISSLRSGVQTDRTHELVNSMHTRTTVLEKEKSRLEGFQAGRQSADES